ncbi:hypothetical protein CO051_06550 [Candidatus Roizmanbacteria bacterium CG_4_9_14_0_2_um_filter_39_13]|uniref:Transcription regulator TrmB N-terminal domain-containing protein n=2 Tax=Candidatus Roizmaniibacteriota TaxID=1752723 RepID=A0A2M8EWM6_9BACT|nr:MAG: hypothetical protein COY15_02110 [Candidatus Roizmanbacteria bacterium CG_4_10_14_0_2_um_filter_39_12]PJC30270.1 MAG: hypothetical protein CO051_06550 [Candidatus Roizmanbacteria bacterium CG_4_9_14_0_2_um_filter_39_13]PJE61841.1 MAG: hypothetical protein COU87_02385 [Candidatus Roizmanbacteria bacterium CG10_big_fil_rev_8_21_14_0_10_39_12]
MDKLKHNLNTLGLSEEEISIYITALEQGSTTVLELARITKIPRTTVYLLIDSLTEKGLLQLTADGKKKLYVPASPEELINMATKKRDQLEKSISSLGQELPQLQALYNMSHQKPKIRYYEGIEEVKKIYEDSLSAEKIYFQHMSEKGKELMGEYGETYWALLMQKMIHTKQIIAENDKNRAYIQNESTQRNQMICIPEKYSTNIDYIIYGDNVAFITYKDRVPVGVVISDPEIVHFEKIRFMMVWEKFSGSTIDSGRSALGGLPEMTIKD